MTDSGFTLVKHRPPIRRARAFSGLLLIAAAVTISACGGSRGSETPTAIVTSAATSTAAAAAPTLTPGNDSATDASFRAFAEATQTAMRTKDAAFFHARLHETSITCSPSMVSSGSYPACTSAGQVITGVGAAGWHGAGVIADDDSIVRDLTGYAASAAPASADTFGAGDLKLIALARLSQAQAQDGYVAIFTEISTHADPATPSNRTARVLVCGLYNSNWQIVTVIAASDRVAELLAPNASNGFLKDWVGYP